MARKEAPVRCVECRHEYEPPERGEEIACPECGCRSWVSTQISDAPLEAA
jgi:DNA-directed RNA polymerase subunit RPC12/RpoP